MSKTPNTKTCPICNNEHTNRGITCSPDCAKKLRETTNSTKKKKCALCDTEFSNKDGVSKYCSKPHSKKCEICGKDFQIPKGKESKANPTCGPSCGAKYSHRKPESKQKRISNNLKKYGVEHSFQRDDVKEKIKQNANYRNTLYGSKGFTENMMKKHNVSNGFLLPSAVPGRISKINRDWKEKLEETTKRKWELEYPVYGLRTVDLFVEHNGVKLIVEVNPTPTHNSHKNLIACNKKKCDVFPCANHAKDKYYHQDRIKFLHDNGYSVVSIFDWMNEDRILNFILGQLKLNVNHIGARKTELRHITQTEANRFLKKYHQLGASRKQNHCFGLFYSGELVQVQTFSETKDRVFEAKRLAWRFTVAGQ